MDERVEIEQHEEVLQRCEVCGKPLKVKRVIANFIAVETDCLCNCSSAALEKQREDWKEGQRRIRIGNLRTEGIVDVERRKCTFAVAEPSKYISMCKNYVAEWETMKKRNMGMLLWGTCGNGKSFAAACIANALIDRGVPALMTSFPAILKDFTNESEIERIMREYDLVIIDDLGAERQSEYALEKIFYAIDERYKSGKPLIVTTNQPIKVMNEYRNGTDMRYSRIYDRILEMCIPIPFDAPTRRKEPMRDKVKVFNEKIFGNA